MSPDIMLESSSEQFGLRLSGGRVFRVLNFIRSRGLRLIVMLLQAAWFNVVVPGHRRGAVALPAEQCAAQSCAMDACCPEMAGDATAPRKAPASGDPAAHCAICQFATALFTPPAGLVAPKT